MLRTLTCGGPGDPRAKHHIAVSPNCDPQRTVEGAQAMFPVSAGRLLFMTCLLKACAAWTPCKLSTLRACKDPPRARSLLHDDGSLHRLISLKSRMYSKRHLFPRKLIRTAHCALCWKARLQPFRLLYDMTGQAPLTPKLPQATLYQP